MSSKNDNRKLDRLSLVFLWLGIMAVVVRRMSQVPKPATINTQVEKLCASREHKQAGLLPRQEPLVDSGALQVAVAITSIGFAISAFAPTHIDIDLTPWIEGAFFAVPIS